MGYALYSQSRTESPTRFAGSVRARGIEVGERELDKKIRDLAAGGVPRAERCLHVSKMGQLESARYRNRTGEERSEQTVDTTLVAGPASSRAHLLAYSIDSA